MKLEKLFDDIVLEESVGNMDIEIESIHLDSREVESGGLFFAYKGYDLDGHDYIDSAIEAGAIAIVCEEIPETKVEEITYLKLANVQEQLPKLASVFYGNPSERLKLVGVTGTNGKTTIATLGYELTRLFGEKAGLLSTIENKVDDRVYKTKNTTSDIISTNKLLREMVDAGVKYAFMEVSSHGIEEGRIEGLNFDIGIFTNLTLDHLNYHKTMENYGRAKKKFFDDLSDSATSIVNIDDEWGRKMVEDTQSKIMGYSVANQDADFLADIKNEDISGTDFTVDGVEINSKIAGKFNVYNMLAIYATGKVLGLGEKEDVAKKCSELTGASGRFETVIGESGVIGIVDYAHTPDAIENVLQTINNTKEDSARIITVVGCGGGGNTDKRPEIARISKKLSDMVILTSDNPRDEDPVEIIEMMKAGIKDFDNVLEIINREEAIKTGLEKAEPGDIVLVAGKGHEDYQEIKGVRNHFCDMEVVEKYLS